MSNPHDHHDGTTGPNGPVDAGASAGSNQAADRFGSTPPRPPLPQQPVGAQPTLPFPDLSAQATQPFPDLAPAAQSQPFPDAGRWAHHGQQGSAFGAAAAAAPAPASAPESKRRIGGGKVAAVLVAALLIGGGAGVGGSYLGSVLWDSPASSAGSGPSTITVNNPGSVNETTAIATQVLPSVVTIEVSGGTGGGSGSGVVLSKDGYILTNTHVVTLDGQSGSPTIRVTTSDGRIFSATVVGLDPIYDLAVIKLDGATDLTPITFGDSSKLNVGDTTVAVGAPLGLKNTVTTGIVSALGRSISIASSAVPTTPDTGEGDTTTPPSDSPQSPFFFDIPGQSQTSTPQTSISIAVIQTDAAINPGNSGGALVNSKGELIGINVAIATAGGSSSSSQAGSIGVGFSIPSNIAKRVSEEIIDSGQATHGLLGATVGPASAQKGATQAGAFVQELTTGGAAEQAGIKAGDVVVEFNGVSIGDQTDLTAQVRAAAGGSKATVVVLRDGKRETIDVTLGTLKGS